MQVKLNQLTLEGTAGKRGESGGCGALLMGPGKLFEAKKHLRTWQE